MCFVLSEVTSILGDQRFNFSSEQLKTFQGKLNEVLSYWALAYHLNFNGDNKLITEWKMNWGISLLLPLSRNRVWYGRVQSSLLRIDCEPQKVRFWDVVGFCLYSLQERPLEGSPILFTTPVYLRTAHCSPMNNTNTQMYTFTNTHIYKFTNTQRGNCCFNMMSLLTM